MILFYEAFSLKKKTSIFLIFAFSFAEEISTVKGIAEI